MSDLERKKSTIRRMAGNIAAGLVQVSFYHVQYHDPEVDLDKVAYDAVRLANAIWDRTAIEEKSP